MDQFYLKDSKHKNLQGVLIKKIYNQKGTWPLSRAFAGLTTLSNQKFVMYGGKQCGNYNDMLLYSGELNTWDVLTKQMDKRYGHVMCGYDNYVVVFGGYGETKYI